MAQLRQRLAVHAGPEQGLRSLMHLGLLALLDGLGVLAVWVICNAATGARFNTPTGPDRLGAAILDGIFHWRLYVLLFLIVLRPALPQARLCDVADHDARGLYARVEVVMLAIIVGRILRPGAGGHPDTAGCHRRLPGVHRCGLCHGLRLAGPQLPRRRRRMVGWPRQGRAAGRRDWPPLGRVRRHFLRGAGTDPALRRRLRAEPCGKRHAADRRSPGRPADVRDADGRLSSAASICSSWASRRQATRPSCPTWWRAACVWPC